jgi:hypothetical protein
VKEEMGIGRERGEGGQGAKNNIGEMGNQINLLLSHLSIRKGKRKQRVVGSTSIMLLLKSEWKAIWQSERGSA